MSKVTIRRPPPPPPPLLPPRRTMSNESDATRSRPSISTRDSQSPSRIPRLNVTNRSLSGGTLDYSGDKANTPKENPKVEPSFGPPDSRASQEYLRSAATEVAGQPSKMVHLPPSSSCYSPEGCTSEVEKQLRIFSEELNKAMGERTLSPASPSTQRDGNPGNLGETKVTCLSTAKDSLGSFPSFTRAKKFVIILDATQSRSVSLPAKTGRYPRTNLKRLSDSLAAEHKRTGMSQFVYYASGRSRGGDFGLNRSLHTTILEAYTYLSANWSPGDEICLFGFSHGAFAVRALAALLTEIGLFNKAGMTNFEALYDTYFDPKYGRTCDTDDYEAWRTACDHIRYEMTKPEGVILHKVSVKFLGCLDTIGWSDFQKPPSDLLDEEKRLWKQGYFNFRHLLLNEDIEYAVHALALDEERPSHAPLLMFRSRDSVKPLRQVWFTGTHINIGGGQLGHEVRANVPWRKQDPNELSDIVFLFLITECHEILTFSKKHISNALAGSRYKEAGSNASKESTYKNRWVAGRIDEPWGRGGRISSLLHAKLPRKRHVRTPLRYRPHWFEDEQWRCYSSHESIHASSRYRKGHHPQYIPKALADYRCTKSFGKFGPPFEPREQAPETGFVPYTPSKIGGERFFHRGVENPDDKLYTGDISLPITPMTTFEILTAGGQGLIHEFAIAFKDIYRETPPVFPYSLEELNNIQEGWILELESHPSNDILSISSSARVSSPPSGKHWKLGGSSARRSKKLRVTSVDNLRNASASTLWDLAKKQKQLYKSKSQPLQACGADDEYSPNHHNSLSQARTCGSSSDATTLHSQLLNRGEPRNRIYEWADKTGSLMRNKAGDSDSMMTGWWSAGVSEMLDADVPLVEPLKTLSPAEPESAPRLSEEGVAHPYKYKQREQRKSLLSGHVY
ncbi:hypothetical protein TWF696_008056 [Orbilia brochopaga]|uniref:T6SS Phospholipase effector Tle1-like catalytic domain-containing protein n=1 Tax=Orbilia brochopaga TaxID=3140254 RepID=A0AAV9UMQ8_9PEZI